MRLGTLTKYMHLRGIHSLRPKAPFPGLSSALIVQPPKWCVSPNGWRSWDCSAHNCSIISEIDQTITGIKGNAQGLESGCASLIVRNDMRIEKHRLHTLQGHHIC
jgi:hypothetical protein